MNNEEKKKTPKYKSILVLHNNKIKEFSEENKNKKINTIKNIINENNLKIQNIDNQIHLNKINNINIHESSLADKNFFINKNKELYKQIEYINSDDEYSEYMLKTYDIINKYTDLNNKEKNIFKNNKEDINIDNELSVINNEKIKLINEYMTIVDPLYNYNNFKNNIDICPYCKILLQLDNSFYVCYECGYTCDEVVTTTSIDELSYKELQNIDQRPRFVYQKENHLSEWIKRFQAKENKYIPQHILDAVISEAKKERITDLTLLSELKVKKYLKKLELNDYYDNIITIINKINNRPPFILTNEIEEKIQIMFKQIQKPFEKFKNNRKNMLSYSYILNKFFLILNLPEFSKYFVLLKSPEKLRQQDEIFKKIIDEMVLIDPKTNWKFFPSI